MPQPKPPSAETSWCPLLPRELRASTARTLRGTRYRPKGRRWNPMVRRRLIGRSCLDRIGVAAWSRPEHQADRHGMRQLRADLSGDLGILLLIGAQSVGWVVHHPDITRRHFDLRRPQES